MLPALSRQARGVGSTRGGQATPIAKAHILVELALLDDLVRRGLDAALPRLFIIDGSKALSQAIRRSFGRDTRCSAAMCTRRATSSR